MSINIRIYTIYKNYLNLYIEKNETIERLKLMIQDKIGGLPEYMYLYFNNKFLSDDDNRTIADYNIQEGSIIYQSISELEIKK
jgi:hypothetical protein